MNNNYESHAISRRSFLKASGVVGAAGILAACGGNSGSSSTAASSGATSAPNTTGATPLTDACAEKAIKLVSENLRRAVVVEKSPYHIGGPAPRNRATSIGPPYYPMAARAFYPPIYPDRTLSPPRMEISGC